MESRTGGTGNFGTVSVRVFPYVLWLDWLDWLDADPRPLLASRGRPPLGMALVGWLSAAGPAVASVRRSCSDPIGSTEAERVFRVLRGVGGGDAWVLRDGSANAHVIEASFGGGVQPTTIAIV